MATSEMSPAGTSETSTDVRYTAAFGGNADNQPVIARQSRFMSTRPKWHVTQFWQRRTNVWRRVTSPAWGAKRLRSVRMALGALTRRRTTERQTRRRNVAHRSAHLCREKAAHRDLLIGRR